MSRSRVETRLDAPTDAERQSCGIRLCQYCGTPYEAKRPEQRFCKTKCRTAAWNDAHPRVFIGAVKLEGKPTAEQLESAGFKVRKGR